VIHNSASKGTTSDLWALGIIVFQMLVNTHYTLIHTYAHMPSHCLNPFACRSSPLAPHIQVGKLPFKGGSEYLTMKLVTKGEIPWPEVRHVVLLCVTVAAMLGIHTQ
jgi:hypothetical protein